jgi:hypothetical protein
MKDNPMTRVNISASDPGQPENPSNPGEPQQPGQQNQQQGGQTKDKPAQQK